MSFDWSQFNSGAQFHSFDLEDFADLSDFQTLPSTQAHSDVELPDLTFSDGFQTVTFGCSKTSQPAPSHPSSEDSPCTTAKDNTAAESAEGLVQVVKQIVQQHCKQRCEQHDEQHCEQLFSRRLQEHLKRLQKEVDDKIGSLEKWAAQVEAQVKALKELYK
ncbi:uncharacterized protein PgNI_02701 [Pyricularia grisea]|uniref:Uncharacterized protein n=1 Tax=Pyricularia grisea TaxID=148305 RepID=A0A6P8B9A5_PYRGI|nr:uncharacterized protein PgNI_02701 [Pyricularia grisea]TLD12232.1 hypothetical protein PgNI_02701 [Pyricularia grisea]